MSSPRISAFIVCFNEAHQIRRCLESVRWCSEIVVIDSGSTDGTVSICKEYTDKVYHRDWTGYVDQKQFGLSQCTGDWVFNLDADEEVSPDLQREIEQILEQDEAGKCSVNGFFVSRIVFFLGRWWRRGGWYPEFRLRLCRRNLTSWGGSDPHEKALVTGRTARLTGELFHYTYSDLTDQVSRLNRYSSSASLGLSKRGKEASLLDLIGRPVARFIKFYLLKRGYRDGKAGFIVAISESYYVFLKYAKLWELRKRHSDSA